MNHKSTSVSTQAVWVFMALTLVLQVVVSSPTHRSQSMHPHHLSKRSSLFFDIQCKGVYNKSIFARLDRICEDCFNLFKEPVLHSLCKKDCFTSDYFKGCVDSLQITDEVEAIQTMIKQIHGAEPGV